MRMIDADALSRVVKLAWDTSDSEDFEKSVFIAIATAPTIEPEPRWIPCSERLPAYGEDVILAIGKFCNVGYLVAVNDETDGEWYYSGWYHPMNDVIAWMPLPEPYREDIE